MTPPLNNETTLTTLSAGTADAERVCHVPGTYNFRDLGGLPFAAGGHTRSGVLFRSDALHALTDPGRRMLQQLGIGRIIDLRSDSERAGMPSAVEGLGIPTVHRPVHPQANPRVQVEQDLSLAGIYVRFITEAGEGLTSAVREVAAHRSPALVHCTAGKDRTGVVVAMILDLIGVEREAIVEDYTSTERYLAGEWAEQMLARYSSSALPRGMSQEAIEEVVTLSPASCLTDVFARLDAAGGTAVYLQRYGLTAQDIDALYALLAD
ncbi:tyrosine-protein phosphatase [Nesterenkonia flava]|uniref:Tyrosine-protein phosphatase n=1 Tax=Nesterenkonia flava TaxID=469799 RepID=A0ABU1FSD2_9MICC|nr:tyrosine-protein phosphatase [Nesterenkonia flava]MDR5711580.1 tyrosine-protein phosphatase [Nesterenkonia flava]